MRSTSWREPQGLFIVSMSLAMAVPVAAAATGKSKKANFQAA
jgi:hypothetical protein